MNMQHLSKIALRLSIVPAIICAAAPCFAALGFTSSPEAPRPGAERTYEALEIDSRVYTNATVSFGRKDIFIEHAAGISTIKIASLSDETKELLGFKMPKPGTNTMATWTKAQVSKIQAPELKSIETTVRSKVPFRTVKGALNPVVMGIFASLSLACFVFFSFCCKQICEKSNTPPTPLIWIPILQLLPLFRAAGMPPIWFLASLLPGLNLVAYAIWCFKISEARKKGFGMALALLFPLTSPLAFMYLAFGGGIPPATPAKARRPEMMTLEAA